MVSLLVRAALRGVHRVCDAIEAALATVQCEMWSVRRESVRDGWQARICLIAGRFPLFLSAVSRQVEAEFKEQPAGAEAQFFFETFAARVNSCPDTRPAAKADFIQVWFEWPEGHCSLRDEALRDEAVRDEAN
jgi:hypothetical protein